MKKEDFKELCDLSEKALGSKYAWKKLRTKGLISGKQHIGRGAIARRMPLSVEGVKHYLKTTLDLQEKIRKDLEAKNADRG